MNYQINYFRRKMKDIGVTEEKIFILMRGDVGKFYPNFVSVNYKSIPIMYYSDYRTNDADWVKEAPEKIKSES